MSGGEARRMEASAYRRGSAQEKAAVYRRVSEFRESAIRAVRKPGRNYAVRFSEAEK